MKKTDRKPRSRGDKLFDFFVYFTLVIVMFIILYPLYFVVIASLSDPMQVITGKGLWKPISFNTESYRLVFKDSRVITGYRNTILYTTAGTLLNVLMSIAAAYPMSRRNLKGKSIGLGMMLFTMFFSGGMIPSFINIRNLGIMNTTWAVLLPGAINATNMLIMRNYFINSIPGELREAAAIDGCSPLRTMMSIILPLSKSILVVITLYYFVGHWNSYFDAMMYLRDTSKYPLQVTLRQILLLTQMGDMSEQMGVNDLNVVLIYASLKYAILIVSAVRLLVIYPMIQGFFEKGIMLGSIKG